MLRPDVKFLDKDNIFELHSVIVLFCLMLPCITCNEIAPNVTELANAKTLILHSGQCLQILYRNALTFTEKNLLEVKSL